MPATSAKNLNFDDLFAGAREIIRSGDHCVITVFELLDELSTKFGARFAVPPETYKVLDLIQMLWGDEHVDRGPSTGWIEFAWREEVAEPAFFEVEPTFPRLRALLQGHMEVSSGTKRREASSFLAEAPAKPPSDPEQPNSPMPPAAAAGSRPTAWTTCVHGAGRSGHVTTWSTTSPTRWRTFSTPAGHRMNTTSRGRPTTTPSPNFDGDPDYHHQQITAAQNQLAAAASQLVKLAMPPDLRVKAETPYKPFWWGPDESPREFDGIHAAIEWGYAKVSSPQPIECNRLAVGHLKDMVERREVLMPGETPQSHEVAWPGEPGGWPWMELTQAGAQALIEYDGDVEDD